MVIGECPVKVGGVHERLTEVEVNGLTNNLVGRSGGPVLVCVCARELICLQYNITNKQVHLTLCKLQTFHL